MTFTLAQKKEAYKKLSPESQDFVMDNNLIEFNEMRGLLKDKKMLTLGSSGPQK